MMFFILVLGYNILFYLGEYCFETAENHLVSGAFLFVFLICFARLAKFKGSLILSLGRKYERALPFTAWIIPGLFCLWSMVQTTRALLYGVEAYPLDMALGTLLLVTAAAVYEELLFRGFIFEYLLSYGDACALWGSGILFAAAHMFNGQFGDFGYAFAIRIGIALCLGYCFSVYVFLTKSLFPSLFLHILINATSPCNYLKVTPLFEGYDLWIYAVLALACLIYGNRLYRQQKKVW